MKATDSEESTAGKKGEYCDGDEGSKDKKHEVSLGAKNIPDAKTVKMATLDLELGITDSADVAFVIPWKQLPRLYDLFPGLKVRHFECTSELWSTSCQRPRGTNNAAEEIVDYRVHSRCHTNYQAVVDATDDAELWDLPAGSHVWEKPDDYDPSRGGGSAALPRLSVDVILHMRGYSHEGLNAIMTSLVRCVCAWTSCCGL